MNTKITDDDDDDMVTVRLTRKQLEKLEEVLWEAQDEGPYGQGWASPELQGLRALFDAEGKS